MLVASVYFGVRCQHWCCCCRRHCFPCCFCCCPRHHLCSRCRRRLYCCYCCRCYSCCCRRCCNRRCAQESGEGAAATAPATAPAPLAASDGPAGAQTYVLPGAVIATSDAAPGALSASELEALVTLKNTILATVRAPRPRSVGQGDVRAHAAFGAVCLASRGGAARRGPGGGVFVCSASLTALPRLAARAAGPAPQAQCCLCVCVCVRAGACGTRSESWL
jgi:hypothetical protein